MLLLFLLLWFLKISIQWQQIGYSPSVQFIKTLPAAKWYLLWKAIHPVLLYNSEEQQWLFQVQIHDIFQCSLGLLLLFAAYVTR